jgi:hypothetical protein
VENFCSSAREEIRDLASLQLGQNATRARLEAGQIHLFFAADGAVLQVVVLHRYLEHVVAADADAMNFGGGLGRAARRRLRLGGMAGRG